MSNIDDPEFGPEGSGNEWITCASEPIVTLTRPPNPSFGSLETVRPNWCRLKELFWESNTLSENPGGFWMFLFAQLYPASMYPFMLMPEASSTCPRVGTLACAKAAAG